MAKYDYVIIGSGLGGLQCAYILSKEGYNVCVLEKNRQLGGNLQIFVRDKAIFDTGIHYIGGLEKGQNLYRYFKYFGLMDKLKLRKLDMDGFDVVAFKEDDSEYNYAQGYDNFIETMAGYFPKERDGIVKYCDMLKLVCNQFPLYNLEFSGTNVVESPYLYINAKEFIDSCTTDVKLRNVLAGTNPLYAGIAHKTPIYVHALIINTYIESAWKCVDGGSQIARILAGSIKENGGTIMNYSEVTKLQAINDKIAFAELSNGNRIEGNHFISNAPTAKTLDLIEGGNLRPAYKNRIRGLENTISVFIVHIVFKKNTFKYFNKNYYYYGKNDVWAGIEYKNEDWPLGFALFAPATSKSEIYADAVSVMSYMKYEEVKKWENTFHTIPKNISDRGDGYSEFKRDKSEKLIDLLENKFPGIRQKIKSYSSTSPLSYRDYIGTTDGSLYGVLKDSQDPLKTFISPKTKIPNLLLTGQNLSMHGVLGVTISAVKTCSEIFGLEYLLNKIKNV